MLKHVWGKTSCKIEPTQKDALKGYIVMSRVESAGKIAIAQPFSPALFRQGLLRSAEFLLDVLRGKIQVSQQHSSKAAQQHNKF